MHLLKHIPPADLFPIFLYSMESLSKRSHLNLCHALLQACCCSMLHHGSLQPSRFFDTLQLCMEEFYSVMMPVEVLHLYVSCREAHALTVADAVAAAHFANSRWYSADVSISVWRSIWQQCVVASTARGWPPTVWGHAELLIEGQDCSEFDDWSKLLSSESDFHELCVPLPESRQMVVHGLEEYLAWKTNIQRSVRGILALFFYYQPPSFYWSFMLALDDNTFVAVQIDDFFQTLGMECQIADTICALSAPDNWRIDQGGRLLMCMKGQYQLDDPVEDFFVADLDHVVEDAMWRKGLHKRQALDGAGYTWNEFLQWYINPQLACERWCEAPNIVAPMTLHQTDAPMIC